MATSTIPTAKANLVSALQARGGLAGVQVVNGPPFPDPQREIISVRGANGDQEWSAMGTGAGTRHESYDLEVVVQVEQEGTDYPTVETRCFALMTELENQIRTDPTLGAAVAEAFVGPFRLDFSMPDGDGMKRMSILTVQVHCEAFI